MATSDGWIATDVKNDPVPNHAIPAEPTHTPQEESNKTDTKPTIRKKRKEGKKINRPLEYNYPQKCEFCGQIFLEKEMVRHKKVHPESFTLDCVPCGKFFQSEAAYDLHYNIHKVYHCIECKRDFNARKHYRSHMERIHKSDGERPRIHACEICNKTFKDKFVLNTHKKTHYNVKAHQCPLCEYACNNLTYMRQHILNHTSQLQFKCHICYRNFLSDELLRSHINKLHSNEPLVYNCNVCGKQSSSKGNLRQHEKIHNPDHNQRKDHACGDCGKLFSLKSRLKKHILVHKGQNKCHCSICGKLLSKDSYRKHLKAHSGEKPFLCDYCGECFASNSCLKTHRRTHTGEKVERNSLYNIGEKAERNPVFNVGEKIERNSVYNVGNGTDQMFPQQRRMPTESQQCSEKQSEYFCDSCGKVFPHQEALTSHQQAYHPNTPFIFITYTSPM